MIADADKRRRYMRDYARAWRAKHPDKVRATRRRYYAAHKTSIDAQCRKYSADHAAERRQYNKAYYAANRATLLERAWKANISRKYNITPAAYDEILTAQGGRCAICGTSSARRRDETRLVVDHCHATGTVRGLLCHACNRAIGLLKDDADILERAAAYLRQ